MKILYMKGYRVIRIGIIELSGFFFWGGEGGGLVNDDVTLEGVHQMITLDYRGEGGV